MALLETGLFQNKISNEILVAEKFLNFYTVFVPLCRNKAKSFVKTCHGTKLLGRNFCQIVSLH